MDNLYMGNPLRKPRIVMHAESIAGTGVTVISHPDGSHWLIDTEDAERIAWATWKDNGSGYAQCGSGKRPLMHRCVLNYSGPLEVDHINGDRTDNRKANLRLVTKTQNSHNRKQHKGLKGVQRRGSKYVAKIKLSKNTYLGSFDTAEDAHAAYVAAAKEHFGDYARAE